MRLVAYALALQLGSGAPVSPPAPSEPAPPEPTPSEPASRDPGPAAPTTSPTPAAPPLAAPPASAPAQPSASPSTATDLAASSRPALPPNAPAHLGGYRSLGEWRPPEPRDGDGKIVTGSIIFPLGFVSVIVSAPLAYLATTSHCTETLGLRQSSCGSFAAFQAASATQGALMLVTGAVLVAVGLIERRRHAAWKRTHSSTHARVRVIPAALGVAF